MFEIVLKTVFIKCEEKNYSIFDDKNINTFSVWSKQK